jgi:hypothetical protein
MCPNYGMGAICGSPELEVQLAGQKSTPLFTTGLNIKRNPLLEKLVLKHLRPPTLFCIRLRYSVSFATPGTDTKDSELLQS